MEKKQQVIYEKLAFYSNQIPNHSLADLYASSIELKESQLKAKVSLGAHCVREIMEKLPEAVIGRTGTIPKENWDDILALLTEWNPLRANWSGPSIIEKSVDAPLAGFLLSFDTFSIKRSFKVPKREELMAEMVKYFSRAHQELSPGYINGMWSQWKATQSYMTNASHGRGNLNEEVYLGHFDKFETILYNNLRQPTSELMSEIEALIKKAEGK